MSPSGLVSEILRLRHALGAALLTHARIFDGNFMVSLERQANLELRKIKINIPHAWSAVNREHDFRVIPSRYA